MRNRGWLPSLLVLVATSALGANYVVSIGDDAVGFSPPSITINVGDSVTFIEYIDVIDTGPHNVIADDSSFRCAAGCDGEGGDGTPFAATYRVAGWTFTRTFSTPGVIRYHDEVSHDPGVIIVQGGPFVIGPGISGAWYDPAQSGHGLFVEVLANNRFYATWLTFNPAGTAQAWFTGIGTYSGNTATITEVELPTGGRWIPNFNPNEIVRTQWGTLTFTFTDCNHGTVDFNSVAGYGSGSMNLTRSTQPAGLSCP